jgi:hypothetical protein
MGTGPSRDLSTNWSCRTIVVILTTEISISWSSNLWVPFLVGTLLYQWPEPRFI